MGAMWLAEWNDWERAWPSCKTIIESTFLCTFNYFLSLSLILSRSLFFSFPSLFDLIPTLLPRIISPILQKSQRLDRTKDRMTM